MVDLLGDPGHTVLDVLVGQLRECIFVELLIVFGSEHMVVVPVTSDPSSQVHVLLHHCGAVGVNGAQLAVLEQLDQVALGGFLKSSEGLLLEAELIVDARADLSDEPLEGGPRKKLGDIALVLLDLSESDCPWLEALLHFFLSVDASFIIKELLDDLLIGLLLLGFFQS